MESVIAAMVQADLIDIPEDYVTAVKGIFARAVAMLDPSAELVNTGYFNHSAVPDYLLKWRGDSSSRSVYLRRSYEEIAGWRDVEHLHATSPVIVSLLEGAGDSAAELAIKVQVRSHATHDLLVTGGLALDRLQGRDSGPDASPIADMISARLLKSGRGVVDAERAERLSVPDGALVDELDESFQASASAALRNAAELIAAAIDDSAPSPTATGPLSVDEARRLLPWLLARAARNGDDDFWAALGRRVDLRVLQEISDAIQGMDLSPLVYGSWDTWEARRGYLGVAVDTDDGLGDAGRPLWFMRERLLTCRVGTEALRFATYGQAFKGRGVLSSALWARIEPQLPSDARLVAISLKGPDKSITFDANDSIDLRRDVRQMVATTEANLFVDRLGLEFVGMDGSRRVDVDLGERIVQGEAGVTLHDLAHVLSSVVAYSSPISLRRGPGPVAN